MVRQAKDSEILSVATNVRSGKRLRVFKGKEVQVIPKSKMVSGMYTWADQIICAKNTTRNFINKECRIMKWNTTSREPVVGDKIICLNNNDKSLNGLGEPLTNGLTGTLTGFQVGEKKHRLLGRECWINFLPTRNIGEKERDKTYYCVDIDYEQLLTGVPSINQENFLSIPKKLREIESFDYGYCITAWKSQGSEYNKVMVFDEKFFEMDEDLYRKFLYTACTRAKEKLLIVK